MFKFKKFTVEQDLCAMKVGTDSTLLGAWANGGRRILDVGTGTGLLALMMAQRYEDAQVTAIDIDEGAVRQARINIENSPFAERVAVRQVAVQHWQTDVLYDAIICNPPYFINSLQAPESQRTIARHTVTLTYEDLMQSASRLLTMTGEISVIVPFDYRQQMTSAAVLAGLFASRSCAVRTSPSKSPRRFLLAFSREPVDEMEKTQLLIDSPEYRQLVRDFYLKY